MPDENDLKRMFESIDLPGGSGIDAKQVIRRSRARRLPKQLAAGAGGALVLVGVTVLGVQSMQLGPSTTSADAPVMQQEYGESGPESEDSMTTLKGQTAAGINECGASGVVVDVNSIGLVLDVVFPATASAASESIDGTVIMTNITSETVTGSALGAPAITLTQDGITVWHTNGPADLSVTAVDLAPGEAMEFPASFEPRRCAPEDEIGEAFRPDLPPAGPGSYEISAALDFSSDQVTGTTEAFLITGLDMPITLE
jgi:hypothetical protein